MKQTIAFIACYLLGTIALPDEPAPKQPSKPLSVEITLKIRGTVKLERTDKKSDSKIIRITTDNGVSFLSEIPTTAKLHSELNKFLGKQVTVIAEGALADPPFARCPIFTPILEIHIDVISINLDDAPKK